MCHRWLPVDSKKSELFGLSESMVVEISSNAMTIPSYSQ